MCHASAIFSTKELNAFLTSTSAFTTKSNVLFSVKLSMLESCPIVDVMSDLTNEMLVESSPLIMPTSELSPYS